jgi:hypothetical protein
MFSKSNLLATLAAGIFNFIGGYLIWGIATTDFFAQHAGSATGVMKDPVDLVFIAIGCFIQAFIMSTIYGKWARGIHSAKEGFEFGALIGVFTGFGVGLIMYGSSNFSDLTGVLVEGMIEIVYYGIIGMIIALVYKATSKKTA